LFSIFIIH